MNCIKNGLKGISGWAEDPDPSHGWADFKVRSGCSELCPVVSDISKDKGFTYQVLWPFSSIWPPSSSLVMKDFLPYMQTNFSELLFLPFVSIAFHPFAVHFQEASGSIFPLTIQK